MATKLLLADDSITIQKVVGIIFSTEEYELTTVGNGDAALEKAREAVPDIMLVDALMPGRSGYEVCQEVRADAALMHIPLLLMTGAFEPFDETRARQCGADDVISKPFESQHLVEKVKALLEIGRQRAEAAPPPVEALTPFETAAPDQPSEPFLAVPLSGPWDEPAQDIETGFEPIPEMFQDRGTSVVSVEPDIASVSCAPPAAEIEIVEVAPGDDPWGIFDLVDLEEQAPEEAVSEYLHEPATDEPESAAFPAEAAPAGEPEQAYMAEDLPGIQDEESYSRFISEELIAVQEQPAPEPVSYGFQSDRVEAKWEPLAEESFAYQDEELTPPGETFAVGMGEPLAMLSNEPEQYSDIPVFESEPIAPLHEEPAAESFADASPEVAPAQVAAPTEEQLRAMLSQISREMIEKIVWEVVPDLAETLIKEEIRKLKQGIPN